MTGRRTDAPPEPADPLARLLAEQIPTGTFGGRRPPATPGESAPELAVDAFAAEHRRTLLEALSPGRRQAPEAGPAWAPAGPGAPSGSPRPSGTEIGPQRGAA